MQFVRGVGPARAAEFALLGVRTVGDLIEHFPFRYDLFPKSQPIGSLQLGTTGTIVGGIRNVRSRGPQGRRVVVASVEDGTGRCRATWFHSAYLLDRLCIGQTVRLTGKVEVYRDQAAFVNPRLTIVDDREDPLAREADAFEPVYPATARLPSRQIGRIIRGILPEVAGQIVETLPEAVRRKRDLPPRRTAILRYHHPTQESDASVARRRLAYDELLLMQVAMQLVRLHRVTTARAKAIAISATLDERIRKRFPFRLTPGQDKAVAEIVADLGRDRPMSRLLQADVGAGKTAVALYAALAVIANRRQVVLLAPTEILAEQHFRRIGCYLSGSRVRLGMLTGGQARSRRGDLYRRAAAGGVDLLVGTHALLEEGVRWPDLGLVIIDEQHRFGVAQRARLRAKADGPHYLVLTATPIPRTLAMALFGDLDVSTIEGLPPGRPEVQTCWVKPGEAHRMWAFVRQHVAAGEQAFVVYPLVEESESMPLKAATAEVARLGREHLAGRRVELLHGRMKSAEKDAVMRRFRGGGIDVLVATTVVEVGIDVPNATVMVIEHADRYGLSQLHQLRGRIGRGSHPSYCFLVADPQNDAAAARLRVLCETRDGFRIAEEDLRLRGPGEVIGTQQHGLPPLRVADLLEDLDLLRYAREDAAELLSCDPALARAEHRALRAAVVGRYAEMLRLIDVA